jgi:protein TonB
MSSRWWLWLVLTIAAGPTQAGAQSDVIRLDPLRVETSHVFHPPTYRSTPLPSYPPAARERGLEGAGLFDVKVLKDGRVGEVKVKRTTGLAILDEAAEQTIKTWTFEPGRRGPDPVESWVEVPVRFSLKQR